MNIMDNQSHTHNELAVELKANPDQCFMLMLCERLEKLEDEVSSLRAELKNHKRRPHAHRTSNYHIVHLVKCYEDVPADIDAELKTMLDDVFRNRRHFHPTFATWHWYYDFELDVLHVEFTLCTRRSLFESALKRYILKEGYDVGFYEMVPDYFMFLKHFYDNVYNVLMDDHAKIEIWARSNIPEVFMNAEPFTTSKNYDGNPQNQFLLKQCICNNEWNWDINLL